MSDAVGCGGGGGGGGGGGAAFLWHAPSSMIALRAKTRAKDLSVGCFNFFLPNICAIDARLKFMNVSLMQEISGTLV